VAVDQRTPGVARVDRGVGLDVLAHAVARHPPAPPDPTFAAPKTRTERSVEDPTTIADALTPGTDHTVHAVH
jgi:hypothetical protein